MIKHFLIVCGLISIVWASPILLQDDPLLQPEEELGDLFEGDIELTEEQKNELFGSNSRTGLINDKYRWINKTVIYDYAEDVNTEQKDWIEKALKNISDDTCVKFRRRKTKDEKDYVMVTTKSDGCSSYVGRSGGQQLLKLKSNKPGSGCFRFGTVIHEFIHALGFYHAQSAYNRDEYVTINWDNIESGHEHNFEKKDNKTTTMYDLGYDYGSVMHYQATAFSVNGEPTIVPK